jgi:HEAT repeat protein
MRAIVGVLLLSCCALSLAEQPMLDYEEQFLHEQHIAITKQAVMAALWDHDAGVRQAASHVLSSRWPEQAVAPIREAMLREDDELVRVYLAGDLAELGSNAGREKLITECHNNENWGSTRIVAARSMIHIHDDSCDDAVLEVLRADSDPQDPLAKVYALNLVPSFIFFHHSNRREYQSVMDLTVKALNDPDGGVRLTTATTLGSLGDPSAIPALQVAVANESDATVRNTMLTELKRLMGVSTSVLEIVWS